MTSRAETSRKLTDDDIKAVRLAGSETTSAELARQLRVSYSVLVNTRGRRTWRALQMARVLGLLPLFAPRKVWSSGKNPVVHSDRFVRGRAQ